MKVLILHSAENVNAISKITRDIEHEFKSFKEHGILDIDSRSYENSSRINLSKVDAVVLVAPAFSRTLTRSAYNYYKKCQQLGIPVYTRAIRVLTPCDVHQWQIKNMPSKVCLGETCIVRINYVDEISDKGINVGGTCTGPFVARFPCMTC